MPTYEYACKSCGNKWDEIQKMSEPALEECPKCHEKAAQRLISQGNFILKGGGWYTTGGYGSPAKSKGDDAPVAASTSTSAASPTTSTTPASATGSSGDSASTTSTTTTASEPSKKAESALAKSSTSE